MTTYTLRKLKPGSADSLPKRNRIYGAQAGAIAGELLRLAVDRAERTFQIEANEVTLTGEEIIEGLRTGHLGSRDLVFERDQWVSLADHDDFFEAARPRARIEAIKRLIPSLLMVAFGAAVIALRLWR